MRRKHTKRILEFYRMSFGFVPSYRVIADGSFLSHVLAMKRGTVTEVLSSALNFAAVRVHTTDDIIAEIESLGREFEPVRFVAKRLIRLSTKNCASFVEFLISTNNAQRYMVATQQKHVQEALSAAECVVPMIHCTHAGQIILEKPTAFAAAEARRVERDKIRPPMEPSPSADVAHRVRRIALGHGTAGRGRVSAVDVVGHSPSADAEGENDEYDAAANIIADDAGRKTINNGDDSSDDDRRHPAPLHVRKRNRAKGPNPLSIRKPKKRPPPPSATDTEHHKRPRRRRHSGATAAPEE